MTADQTVVFILGLLLIFLSSVEFWSPQLKALI